MTKYINIKKAQNESWKVYDSWRKTDGINCPAFRSKVRISLLGWRHLIGATGHKKRISNDVYRRLKLLPHVKTIIENSKLVQNIKKKKGRTYYALEGMLEVDENNQKSLRKIRVIIIEDFKKNKIFLSVMDKK
ncbi:hypothetical protein COW98_03895 [Candidatus Roizmanbacteria bacterium CG22_combo_CG10-13_8_21_14_all_35_9]|uniref:Uncharacterized protein n=4 Tax=Candidatus Roizmaniibacteriota TaxID=1752723 RepID=A0A2M8F0X2_9BACT|nr:MAG: hypothetical protein COX47_02070 [Candidatus Roizmanbacteria bacterium CG23_combo_of_CG06-09_8_20_14_all_35_49]PIP62467.1 MAG: hypothetical protein COW98_03895 [Candidatus Roizmanbacteria bacterium CG22_combo_CG10-13_8_21_14_all_35_9]PIY71107.1 MAG: hypothetical protein COY88_02095 [Candidatus Roizmanbacteria bacterium CG_4_10_14_0_8_um_filter_35_28]PJC32900.1 MAG: hypothetical protein CO048_04110 [Candidatus Roizmanbacteria bacterium CG_4_9_14_0_2_um_filter_35_15]PJC82746.1 MAG: hypoth